MKNQAIVTSVYAGLLLIGGIMGYATASSLPSLIMGSLSALLMGTCAWGMFKGCTISKTSALVLTLLLGSFFAYRFLGTYKFMPSGLMVLLSLGLVLYLQFAKKTAPCLKCN